MAGGTGIFFLICHIGYFAMEFVIEVTFGVLRALEFLINVFMTLFTGVVIHIFGISKRNKRKEKNREPKESYLFH